MDNFAKIYISIIGAVLLFFWILVRQSVFWLFLHE